MKIRLTDLAVNNLKPGARQYEVYCDQTRNFGIRISPAGTKTFFIVTGPPHKRSRSTIGHYPAMSLKDARRAATRFDPRPTTAPTFAVARIEYLAYAKKNLRHRTYLEVDRYLNKTLRQLERKNLEHLSATAIRAELDALTPSVANHAHAVLKTFLNWCARHYAITNPITATPRPYREITRERVLTDDELCAVLTHAPAFGTFGRIVQFLAYSGQRRTETANLRYSWVHSDTVTFPAHITKNAREHTVPLSTPMLTLIGTPPPDLCFMGDSGNAYNTWSKQKRKLDQVLGETVAPWTLHDLRRTWATNAARIGIQPHLTERILNHRTSQTETEISRIYNRYEFAFEKREAMEKMTAFLLSILRTSPYMS